jgi:hypothetical protein
MVVRRPEATYTLGNFLRANLYSTSRRCARHEKSLPAMAFRSTLDVTQGGLLKTEYDGQKYLWMQWRAVSVMAAGQRRPHGMAILAAYLLWKRDGETLDDYLETRVFANADLSTVRPDQAGMDGFNAFLRAYVSGLAAEKAAAESI